MYEKILEEHKEALAKIDELREGLKALKEHNADDSYNIMITRDRLAYWEGKAEGLKFALEQFDQKKGP